MRILKYDLFPEAYGSDNRFMSKEGTIVDFINDTGMLLNSDFDKVIPTINILNNILLQGDYPRTGEWEPFEITQEEYDDLVKGLCSLPLARPYRIDEDIK
jgi:hypothetical protein